MLSYSEQHARIEGRAARAHDFEITPIVFTLPSPRLVWPRGPRCADPSERYWMPRVGDPALEAAKSDVVR